MNQQCENCWCQLQGEPCINANEIFIDIKPNHRHVIMSSHMYVCQHSTVILSLNSLAQDGSTALLVAAYGGSVELVRMLLKEFNSSLDEVNNVSVYFTICITALKQPL